MRVLKECNYERYSITPSIQAMRKGTFTTVYFTKEVSRSYAYGDGDTIHGYIAPTEFIHDRQLIKRMIGYRGTILVISSTGEVT